MPPTRIANARAMLGRNLFNAFKLLLLRRVSPDEIPLATWQIVAYVVLLLMLQSLGALVWHGVGGEIDWSALPDVLYPLALVAISAIAVAYALRQPAISLTLMQLYLMLMIAAAAVSFALFSLGLWGLSTLLNGRADALAVWLFDHAQRLAVIWFAVACLVTTTRLFVVRLRQGLSAALVIGLLLALPLTLAPLDRGLWAPASGAGASMPDTLADEENFYRQPQLLDDALDAITPQRAGVPEVFFIGVAGDGSQDVFSKEVDAVSTLMQQRFDTGGRSISLVNNQRSAGSKPIASVTSLRAALRRIGSVMDTEEDLLFLYLTSHGSQRQQFYLNAWPIQFKELDAKVLRSLLDESGIRHRVLVISACYSGGFIDALKGADTLVITAAAHDKTSFGCSNESEWTYFGEAYFNQALRRTHSFIEAFERAAPAVTAREQKEGHTPSQPQISIGARIRDKLDAVARALPRHPPTPPAPPAR